MVSSNFAVKKNVLKHYAWFPPFRCRSAVAVSPLPFPPPLRRNCRSVAMGLNPIFCRSAIGALVDNQSAFWSLHPYVYGKTFPAFLFSLATATVATERKNGNGMVETSKSNFGRTLTTSVTRTDIRNTGVSNPLFFQR